MRIIPVINCTTVKCFRKRVHQIAEILNAEVEPSQTKVQPRIRSHWVHVDIGKKPFTPKNNVVCVRTLKRYAAQKTEIRHSQTKVKPRSLRSLHFEAHLMMPWNRRSFLAYLRMPFEKIYVHLSEFGIRPGLRRPRPGLGELELAWAVEQAKKFGKELGVVVEVQPFPSTELRAGQTKAKPYELPVSHILVLAVKPGNSGQTFNLSALKIISFLKRKFKNVTITVDGGVEPKLVQKIKKAGSDAATSGSYIWRSKDPMKAYSELRNI